MGRKNHRMLPVIGAVDATFLEPMILVGMDLATGSLLLEEVADDRTSMTWKTRVEERLTALGASVLSLVSDRAQALMQLAEKGLGGFSMPDFFPVVHEIMQRYARALGRQLRQAEQDLAEATATLAQLRSRPQMEWAVPVATATVEAQHTAVQHWAEVQRQYRHQLETRSLTLHPFAIADATPQTSAQVERRLSAAVEAIEAVATRAPLPVRPAALKQVCTQVPALAALVDCWWQGVWRDLEPFALSPDWQHWIQACLLPGVSWEHTPPRPAVPAARRRWYRRWRRSAWPWRGIRSPKDWTARCWPRGTRGRGAGSAPLRRPHRPWKAAPACCPNGIRISAACLRAAIRCRRPCRTSISGRRMGRPRPRVSFGGRFPTSLKRSWPVWRSCHGLGNANARPREVLDVIECPALSGYPWNA